MNSRFWLGERLHRWQKKRRKSSNRLKGLSQTHQAVPKDLEDLYTRYDGVDTPENDFGERYLFFGRFRWLPSDSVNRLLKTRDPFPFGDEILFSISTTATQLTICPTGNGEYILTTAMSAISDFRYPAFDSILSMLMTYRDALKEGAWRFDSESLSIFDNSQFHDIARRHNTHCDYWKYLAEDRINFQLPDYTEESGFDLSDARNFPKPAIELLRDSGFTFS